MTQQTQHSHHPPGKEHPDLHQVARLPSDTTSNSLTKGLENKHEMNAITFYFSKIFYKVHHRFVMKCHYYDKRGDPLGWIKSFIADRYWAIISTKSKHFYIIWDPSMITYPPRLQKHYICLQTRFISTSRYFEDHRLHYRMIKNNFGE